MYHEHKKLPLLAIYVVEGRMSYDCFICSCALLHKCFLCHCPLLLLFCLGADILSDELAAKKMQEICLISSPSLSVCLSVHTAMCNNLQTSDGISLKFVMLLGSFI